MRRGLLQIVLGLGLLGLASPATARSGKKHHKVNKASQSLQTKVMEEVSRTLPRGLKIASMQLPASLERRAARKDTVALRWRRTPTHGRTMVQVLVHKSNGKIRKGWARIDIVRVEGVLVASVDLEAGDILQAGQLKIDERPLHTGQELQFEPSYLVGSRMLSAVAAGDSIVKNDVSMPIPVARGTGVQVEIRTGNLVVTTRGVLEKRAAVGSQTRVRIANRYITGTLIRADLVQMVAP